MADWTALIVAMVLNAAANVLLKIGAATASPTVEGGSPLTRVLNFVNAATSIGIVLFAANVLVYRKALDKLDISVAYPVMVSGGLVLVTLAAVLIPVLNERLGPGQIVGIALIGVGVWLVAS